MSTVATSNTQWPKAPKVTELFLFDVAFVKVTLRKETLQQIRIKCPVLLDIDS